MPTVAFEKSLFVPTTHTVLLNDLPRDLGGGVTSSLV